MTRQELIGTIEKIHRLYTTKNQRKALLLVHTIKWEVFGDLPIPLSNGYSGGGRMWLFHVLNAWSDPLYCRLYLQDALKALRQSEHARAA